MEGRDEQATDARLSIAASQGDDEAFAVLYERYAPRIGAYLSRLLDDEHLAQDLTHEVFVSALRRLRTDRPPIAFGPWLYRIARNASIDVHRRAQIVRQVPLDGAGEESRSASRENGPEAAAEVRQWLEQLRDVLGGLSETHRTVLVLRELEGLSNNEIADRLGVSRPAVEGLLFRARAKLRREYDDLVSGRRCEAVRAALDRAQDGARLTPRDVDLASRHVRACPQCRRHAWEAGLAAFLPDSDGASARRRALVPVPLALAAFTHRLAAKLHAAAEAPAALLAPWGRTAAGLSVVALAGGAAVVPQVRHALPLHTTPAAPKVARVAAPVASPAAAPTTLVASAAPVVAVAPRSVTPAAAPAAQDPPASPAAAPTSLPAADPAPAPSEPDRHDTAPAASSAPGPAAAPPRGDTAPAPHETAVAALVEHVTHRAKRDAKPTAVVENAVDHVAHHASPSPVKPTPGSVLTEATETAQAVVDAAAGADVQPQQDGQPDQSAAGAVSDATGTPPAVTPDPVAAPLPDPPVPPTPPAAAPLPAAPTPQAPALPDPAAAPTPADPPPAPPPHVGTLAERRGAEGMR